MKMYARLHQSTPEGSQNEIVDGIDDVLIEAIWLELKKQPPRDRVRSVVAEIALGYQDAAVKTFLPILVRRQALERLRQELNEIDSNDD